MLGENEGIYVGYSLDTGRNVYLKPALASQGVKGSVTNALASALLVRWVVVNPLRITLSSIMRCFMGHKQ